jgi:hypothetical protein
LFSLDPPGSENIAKADWITESEILTDASYGIELVHVIGKVYTLAAYQFLGSVESGIVRSRKFHIVVLAILVFFFQLDLVLILADFSLFVFLNRVCLRLANGAKNSSRL